MDDSGHHHQATVEGVRNIFEESTPFDVGLQTSNMKIFRNKIIKNRCFDIYAKDVVITLVT